MFLIISSYIADLILGDPEWFPHPVRGIGKLIGLLQKQLGGRSTLWIDPVRNQRFSNGVERTKGAVLTFVVVGISTCFAYLFIESFRKLNPYLGNLVWVYLGYSCLCIKDLRVKARAISQALKDNSIASAREELSKIVGRDTRDLSKDRITVATIESIAESTNDGIVAPLFYLILGGPVLAFAYKAVNTLDSMVGYRNEKYLHLGWFSAKVDDIVNFIPARICGSLISVSSLISGKGFKGPFKTMLKDGNKHPSPNSGIPEAAMAGALGVRLGGSWSYRGKVSTKPSLGDTKRALQVSFITEALTISLISSILMVSCGVILKWLT